MFNLINEMAISPAAALGIYAAIGLVFFHDMKRIRWYALSLMWVLTGAFDRGFMIETAMLGFTYMLVESFFDTYYRHGRAKARARARALKSKD